MASPLPWKDGKGYDIHILRGAPASPSLVGSLVPSTHPNAMVPRFDANFSAASSVLGVSVDSATGAIKADAQPSNQPNHFPSFNFILRIEQVIGGVQTLETAIRVHIHNTVKSIWLTPTSLTPHVGSDESRFTVLARFDDDTIGDITDWPQVKLTVPSASGTALAVLQGGVLKAKQPGKTVVITATLKMTAPPINKSATAQVFTQPSWEKVGQGAKLEFVAGPMTPNEDDLDSDKPDSVKSVESRPNVLFISEGFLKGQEQEFRQKVIEVIVNKELRLKEYLQPFKMLANSINYWCVFVESKEEGSSVLGDQIGSPPISSATLVPQTIQPAATASQWTLSNLMYEGGMPLPNDPAIANPADWVSQRSNLFPIPSGAPGTPAIDQAAVDDWNDLRPRFLLNELNTAFGVAHFDRPRADDQEFSLNRLQFDPRRMSENSLNDFLRGLRFAVKPTTPAFWGVGKTWTVDEKDTGLVCFVCRSGMRGGQFKQSRSSAAYFTASLGDKDRVAVQASGDGQAIVPPGGMSFSAPLAASLVAYGLGRALGLADEEGDGTGKAPGPTSSPAGGDNLQAESNIVSTSGGTRTINVEKIAWLWPRIINGASVEVKLNIQDDVVSPVNCDQNGTPNPAGAFLLIRLLGPPSKPFAKSDAVRLRTLLRRVGSSAFWQSPSDDDIAAYPFIVESVGSGTLVLKRQTPNLPQLGYFGPSAGSQFDPVMFKSVRQCSVILPLAAGGVEKKLVSTTILAHITASNSPLNAPAGAQGQSCTPAPQASADVDATNLPPGFKAPAKLPRKADLIGIYDGGGHFDCGVYRPAGRCRMRRGAKATTPFCQVCRYVIVDRLDPSVHAALDALYAQQYP